MVDRDYHAALFAVITTSAPGVLREAINDRASRKLLPLLHQRARSGNKHYAPGSVCIQVRVCVCVSRACVVSARTTVCWHADIEMNEALSKLVQLDGAPSFNSLTWMFLTVEPVEGAMQQ